MDKILRYSLFLVSVFFVVYNASSQDDTMQDVIFLKNGKTIRGYIISKDSVKIRIVEYGDKLTTVNDSDIVLIEKQAPGQITFYNKRRFKASGFQSQVERMRGYSTNNNPSNGFRLINGYKFKNRYFLGIGIGIMTQNDWGFYDYEGERGKNFPVFLRFSSDLWIKRSTPYAFTDIGSQFQMAGYYKTLKPLFFRCGIGNKFIMKRSIFYFSLAYRYNKARDYTNSYYYYTDPKYSVWYRSHTAELSFGWQFN